MNPTPPKRPSPMRALWQWLFRERALRGPAAIELNTVETQIKREQSAIRDAADEAKALSHRLAAARQELSADLKKGHLSETDARHLARSLMTASVETNEHCKTLEALS